MPKQLQETISLCVCCFLKLHVPEFQKAWKMIGLAPYLHQDVDQRSRCRPRPAPGSAPRVLVRGPCPASPVAGLTSFPVLTAEAKAQFVPQLLLEVPVAPLHGQSTWSSKIGHQASQKEKHIILAMTTSHQQSPLLVFEP